MNENNITRRKILNYATSTTLLTGGLLGLISSPVKASPICDTFIPVEGRKLAPATQTGGKYDIHGNALYFPGVTMVARIPQDSAFYKAQIAAINLMKNSPFALHYAYYPNDTIHSTFMDLDTYLDQSQPNEPKKATWPKSLPSNANFAEVGLAMAKKLSESNIQVPKQIEMKRIGSQDLKEGFLSYLEFSTPELKAEILDTKDNIANLFEMKDPDGRDTYKFHSGLGYRLIEAIPSEYKQLSDLQQRIDDLYVGPAQTVVLEPVGLCRFDDMTSFPAIYYLQTK